VGEAGQSERMGRILACNLVPVAARLLQLHARQACLISVCYQTLLTHARMNSVLAVIHMCYLSCATRCTQRLTRCLKGRWERRFRSSGAART